MLLVELILALAPGEPGSHARYLEQVRAAEASAYDEIMQRYDAHLGKHPDDTIAALERCRFLAEYDEANECSGELVARFPDNSAVLRFRLDVLWGDEAIAFAIETLATPDAPLSMSERAYFHQKMADVLAAEHKLEPAAEHARQALALDGEANVRRTLAAQLLAEERTTEAIAILSNGSAGVTPQELLERARLLVDAGAYGRARWLLQQGEATIDHALQARLAGSTPTFAWHQLVLGVLGLLLLPAVWVLPAHYWSLWRRQHRRENPVHSRWRFRHVWLVHAGFVLGQGLALYWFAPGEAASWISNLHAPPLSTEALARYGVMASALSAALALLLVRPRDLGIFGPGQWTVVRSVTVALVSMLLLFALMALSMRMRLGAESAFDIQRLVRAIAVVYGISSVYLVCAFLAPVVEELVFRSVLLDAYARHMPFIIANCVQAALFAAAHMDLARVPHLFTLGFIAGAMRLRSGGLLASIALHAFNNIVAVTLTLGGVQASIPVRHDDKQELIACLPPGEISNALQGDLLAPVLLNNAAWTIATTKDASDACLRAADKAIDTALREAEEPAFLDTRAQVYWRLGRVAEAVDLERAVAQVQVTPFSYSQVARFLGRHPEPIRFGQGATLEEDALALTEQHQDGVVVWIADANGVLRMAVGPGHAERYRLPMHLVEPRLLLVDGRDCDGCGRGTYAWHYEPHDPESMSLP